MWKFYKLSLTKFSELLTKMDTDFLTPRVVHILFHNSKGHDDYSQLDFVINVIFLMHLSGLLISCSTY